MLKKNPAIPEQTTSALHVLIVDDVAMNRDIAGSFLRTAGHSVTCVEGGAEAIAAIKATDFSVVLMDVRMPEMDGLEATRRIRALPGTQGRMPIVALTARAFPEQVAECCKAGMDSHVAKPFTPDTLHAAVLQAVGRGQTYDKKVVKLTPARGRPAPARAQMVLDLSTVGRPGTDLLLEPDYWAGLDTICEVIGLSFNAFIAQACHKNPHYAVDIAVRVAVATYFRERFVSALTVCSDDPAPVPPLIGLDRLVLDQTAFERAAYLLPSETIGDYVQAIAERAEALLAGLRVTDASRSNDTELAGEANAIAGIAGLFGFDRLNYVGCHFERGVDLQSADSPALADGLCAALTETLSVIHGGTLAAAEA